MNRSPPRITRGLRLIFDSDVGVLHRHFDGMGHAVPLRGQQRGDVAKRNHQVAPFDQITHWTRTGLFAVAQVEEEV